MRQNRNHAAESNYRPSRPKPEVIASAGADPVVKTATGAGTATAQSTAKGAASVPDLECGDQGLGGQKVEAVQPEQDYSNLPYCGGFGLDRPKGIAEFKRAITARFKVAEAKYPDAGIEDFHFYHTWNKTALEDGKIEDYIQNGRIMATARPGDNEGYIVQVLVAPMYLDRGPVIPVAHSKCWSREGALALLQEVSELNVRW